MHISAIGLLLLLAFVWWLATDTAKQKAKAEQKRRDNEAFLAAEDRRVAEAGAEMRREEFRAAWREERDREGTPWWYTPDDIAFERRMLGRS